MTQITRLIYTIILPCGSLEEHTKEKTFQSRGLYLHEETFLLGEQPSDTPIYLLAGSRIRYRFEISANKTLITEPEFFIFDDYKAFRSFILGRMSGVTAAIYHQILAVGTPQNPVTTEITYTVKKDGYYFMTGYSEAGISYQFNATNYVQYLNITDYIEKYSSCRVTSEFSCSFTADSTFFGTHTEYCLVAYIDRPYSEDPPSTHIEVHTKKRYDIIVIPGVVAVVSGIVLVMTGLLNIVAVIIKKRKRRGYSTI